MKIINLLKIGAKMLELMSQNDIRPRDECFVDLYNDYEHMRNNGEKYSVTIMILADKYKTSESSVSRIIRRLSKDVKT